MDGGVDDRALSNGADFEDFFENGGIALHIVGADGTILHANVAELSLLGFSADEYIGRPITDFHADRDVVDDILARLSAGETLRKHPARLRARDGSIRHVEITSSGLFRDGKFVHTRCFTVDVTEAVLMRNQLRVKDDELKQLLDALPAAVYLTDAEGTITYLNRLAKEIAGRKIRVGIDKWCVSQRLYWPDGTYLPHEQCPMAIALTENRPVRGAEVLVEMPDGSRRPFIPYPTPIRDETGRLTGAVNMLVDIADRKEAEAAHRMLSDELNHRVKNNMMMLYGLLRAAQRDAVNDDARAVLTDVCQRVGAMSAAQQLLYGDLDSQTIGMEEFLTAVCDSARQAFGPGVTLQITCSDGSLANDTTTPLALILNELLTNAAKHGSDADGRVSIDVSLAESGPDTLLIVADDGPGFEMRDTGRRSAGIGLVRGLVGQLRGSFSVERASGARCVVRFPRTV